MILHWKEPTEATLPLEAINEAAADEDWIRKDHRSTRHLCESHGRV